MHNGHFESVLVALVQFEWVNFGDEKQEWFGRKNFENTRNYFFLNFLKNRARRATCFH